MLARMNKCQNIIECGTSFGLSTIYLALAVGQNVSGPNHDNCGITTIEKDSTKVEAAKKIWARAGPEVDDWIHPRQGDLLEILQEGQGLPQTIDMLFLDGKAIPIPPASRVELY